MTTRSIFAFLAFLAGAAVICIGIKSEIPIFDSSLLIWTLFCLSTSGLYSFHLPGHSIPQFLIDFIHLLILYTIAISLVLGIAFVYHPEDRGEWALGIFYWLLLPFGPLLVGCFLGSMCRYLTRRKAEQGAAANP